MNRTANDEILAQSIVDSATLVSDYDLQLRIGTGVGDAFVAAASDALFDIGSTITLKLFSTINPYL